MYENFAFSKCMWAAYMQQILMIFIVCFYNTACGDRPLLSKTISNKSASESSSKSNALLPLLWLLLVVHLLSHWESILPIEKSSLLSSYPRAAAGEFTRGPIKQGFGVLCALAGA